MPCMPKGEVISLTSALDKGWAFNTMPWPLYLQEIDPVPIVQEAGWASGLDWMGAEILTSPPAFNLHLSYVCTIPQAGTIPEVSQFTNRWLIHVHNNSGFCPYSYRQVAEDGSTFQQNKHDIATTMKTLKN